MARVIISSGHTDNSPGTVVGDLREVDIARSIAREITPYLRYNGIITLAVPSNLSLGDRINWINGTGYQEHLDDIFVEIHINEGGKSGIEAWYKDLQTGKSKQLAQLITSNIYNTIGLNIESVQDETKHEFGGISILQEVKPIPILLECFYLDNKKDQKYISYHENIKFLAKSIAEGIAKFLNIPFKDPDPNLKLQGEFASKSDNDAVKSNKKDKDLPKHINLNTKSKSITQKDKDKKKKKLGKNDQNDKNQNFQKNVSQVQSASKIKTSDFSFNSNQYNLGSYNTNNPNPNPNPNLNPNPNPNINSNPAFNPPYNSPSYTPSNLNQNSKKMTREERKKMIEKYYKQGFGKEPEKNDVNYFLNIGVSEEQMLKRILESEDHVQLVKNANKYNKLKQKYDKIKEENEKIVQDMKSQREVMKKLNYLLMKKNEALTTLQSKVQFLIRKIEDMRDSQGTPKEMVNYKKSSLDRFFDSLSRILS